MGGAAITVLIPNLETKWTDSSTSRHGHLSAEETAHSDHYTREWVSSRARLGALVKRTTSCLCWESNHDFSVINPAVTIPITPRWFLLDILTTVYYTEYYLISIVPIFMEFSYL